MLRGVRLCWALNLLCRRSVTVAVMRLRAIVHFDQLATLVFQVRDCVPRGVTTGAVAAEPFKHVDAIAGCDKRVM